MPKNQSEYLEDLLNFIGRSPTSFHAVSNFGELLLSNGFTELKEHEPWQLQPDGRYFVRRNSSSLIIFTLDGRDPELGLRMAGAHTDSPGLKIKPNPGRINNSYLQLGVETYGSSLLTTWFDRDLSLAGRVTWKDKNSEICSSLVDFKRPVCIIPSLAIHLDREANDKKSINRQTDLVPVFMQVDNADTPDFHGMLLNLIIEDNRAAGPARILDHELFLYDCHPPAVVGVKNEFITGGRLDNLVSCYTLVRSLLDRTASRNALVVLNDHEEIGSVSTSGAQGTFLLSVLERIMPEQAKRRQCLSRSIFISADNAHGVHPNFADRFDKEHLPLLNRGPVIKFNANQRYATNSLTASFFRMICEQADIPVQEFVMRSDLACGSTIGPLTAGQIGVQTVDVGIPSLAMHSIRETAGSHDAHYLYEAFRTFFAVGPDAPCWKWLAA